VAAGAYLAPACPLTQCSAVCKVGGCGGLVVPTVTGQLWGGGSAAPIGVALWTLLYHV